MFTTEQVLEDFASFAEAARDGWLTETLRRESSYVFHFRWRAHSVVRTNRPEGLKDDVAEVVDERPAWTLTELCERLSLPTDNGTRASLGKILHELGLKCIRGTREVRVYGRGSNQAVAAKFALEVAKTRDRWTTPELLGVLGWPVNRSTQVILGNVLAKGGWVRSRNPVASNRVKVYRKVGGGVS